MQPLVWMSVCGTAVNRWQEGYEWSVLAQSLLRLFLKPANMYSHILLYTIYTILYIFLDSVLFMKES